MARSMDLKTDDYDFQFTRNWFRVRNLPTFREFIYPEWSGKPATYLEIGVFEGMSLVWMLQHILTHEKSKAIGCDPHLMTTKLSNEEMESVRQRAIHNLIPYKDKCELIRGNSAEVLRKMLKRWGFSGIKQNTVDICMIDGNHNSLAALDDARICLELIKPGGWLLFDDVENDREKQDHVKQGLDLFLSESSDRVEFIWKHKYMEAYKKVS